MRLEWRVRVIHVYREANTVIDGPISMVCEAMDGLRILDHPLGNILQFLHADCIGVFTPRLAPM